MADHDPRFKTVPYAHQLAAFERFKDESYGGIWYEQRLGKAKTTLDLAAHKYRAGAIDTLLIVAPNGVTRQWVVDAVPEHLPDDVRGQTVLWQAAKVKQVGIRQKLKELLAYADGLRILSVNIDAVRTEEFKSYANALFRGHRVMTVVDESSDIGDEGSLRSKAALRLGRASRVRFVLDGTPAAAGPLGLYGQCRFLSPDALGFDSFVAFKAHYAELERRDFGERDRRCPDCKGRGWFSSSIAGNNDSEVACPRCHGGGLVGRHAVQVIKHHIDPTTGETVKHYRNLDELKERLSRFSVRLLRSECYDLPPKIYQKVYFELPPDQRRVYQELRDEYATELRSGGIVTATMVLTRYLRLQQVASGFLPIQAELVPCVACGGADPDCAACEGLGVAEPPLAPKVELVGKRNARLDALVGQLEKLPDQGIVWCRFDHDVDAVVMALKDADRRVVDYDGRVTDATKAEAVRAFQGGEADVFVAKPRSAGRGHDLARANWVAYYSHDWSLRMRLQSEDRAQSLKKRDSVLYLDLIAEDTVDDRIVAALRAGKRLSDVVTGDRAEEWL